MPSPRTLTALFVACAASAATFAGPLDPPAGPVDSTGKTLTEVEPRTPLDAPAGQSITIDEPGSYYLTGDRDNLSGLGVRILTGGVTLDLNGFALRGNGGNSIFTTEAGVFIFEDAGLEHSGPIVIRNGSLTDFGDAGIDSRTTNVSVVVEDVVAEHGSTKGIDLAGDGRIARCVVTPGPTAFGLGASISLGGEGTIEDCRVEGAPDNGFFIREGVIRRCIARLCDGNGFVLGASSDFTSVVVVSECVSRDNDQVGFVAGVSTTFVGCTALSNTGNGFSTLRAASLERCVADSNELNGFSGARAATYRDCVARNNVRPSGVGGSGFSVGAGSSLSGCVSTGNSRDGFTAGRGTTFDNCSARDNGVHGFSALDGSVLSGCASTENGAIGFTLGASSNISGSTADRNGTDGFSLQQGSRVTDCSANLNGDDGFFVVATRITGCSSDNNAGEGIDAGNGSTVKDNSAFFNGGLGIVGRGRTIVIANVAASNDGQNFASTSGATLGPVVDDPRDAVNPTSNIEF